MENSRLHCVLFSDLAGWERAVFEALIPALAARMPVSVHEVGNDLTRQSGIFFKTLKSCEWKTLLNLLDDVRGIS